jgi:cyclic dehypoxanthinyl futalosine synthase
MSIESRLAEIVDGKRLSPEQACALLRSDELALLGRAAHAVTERLHPESYRTYNIDRNINYTNICMCGCRFCAFHREPGDPRGYVIDRATLFEKIEQTLALGGDQILLQGGLHPDLPLSWYETLLEDIRERFPQINIHGFSPTEIVHLSNLSGKSSLEVLQRLREAGLGSLPGGGAEILSDAVRREVSPRKATADQWLDVCRQWHRLGGRGSATMMFAHRESIEQRVEHLDRLRRLQDETGGFTAFIAWTLQPANTPWQNRPKAGSWLYLKTLAVARLFLDNFPNLQCSWVTQGLPIGTLSLRFGANDMGSLMIEENVVAAAGTSFKTTEREIRAAIREAGYQPRRRDVFYRVVS